MYIVATIILGDILLPVSLITDNINITPELITSLNLSFYLNVIAFFMLLSGFWLSGKLQMHRPSLSFLKDIELSSGKLFIICMVYYVVGAAILFLTFHATGTIPFFDDVFASKYFRYQLSNYLTYRPFYVLAIKMVAISSLFVLYLSVYSFEKKKYLRAFLYVCLFAGIFFTNLLTAKRGESIMPLFALIGAFTLAGKIKLHYLLLLLGFLVIGIIAVNFGMDFNDIVAKFKSTNENGIQVNNLIEETEQSTKSVSENRFIMTDEKRRWIRSGPWADIIERFTNSMFVELREGGRLLNSFKGHNLYLGKTYLAGFISLIPTRYSSFKDLYVIGRVSMRHLGSDPDTGGGPQIGYTAEAYINFGIFGVITVPFLFGFFLHELDRFYLNIYQSNISEKKFIMIFVFLGLLFLRGFFTNGSGALQGGFVKAIFCIPIYLFAVRNVLTRKQS